MIYLWTIVIAIGAMWALVGGIIPGLAVVAIVMAWSIYVEILRENGGA